jgi:hypothetical protein
VLISSSLAGHKFILLNFAHVFLLFANVGNENELRWEREQAKNVLNLQRLIILSHGTTFW